MKNLLSEKEILYDIIDNGFSSGKASKYELILLAKYYKWEMGLSAQEIKKEIVTFCKVYDKQFNPIISRDLLKDVLRIAENNYFREPVPVLITKKELDKIRTIKNFDYQKFLFVMLVYAKTLKYSNSDATGKSNKKSPFGYFVSLSLIGKIGREVGWRVRKDIIQSLHDLYKLGLIEPTLTGRIKILYSDDSGLPSIKINDYTKVVDYYTNYVGGELLYCANCGSEYFKNIRKTDFCPNCSDERRREQVRQNVARYRERSQS